MVALVESGLRTAAAVAAVRSPHGPAAEYRQILAKDEDVLTLRTRVLAMSAAVGFSRIDQACMAAILASLARQVRSASCFGRVSLEVVSSGPRRGLRAQVDLLDSGFTGEWPCFVQGMHFMDEVRTTRTQSGISVNLAKWLPEKQN